MPPNLSILELLIPETNSCLIRIRMHSYLRQFPLITRLFAKIVQIKTSFLTNYRIPSTYELAKCFRHFVSTQLPMILLVSVWCLKQSNFLIGFGRMSVRSIALYHVWLINIFYLKTRGFLKFFFVINLERKKLTS